MYRIRWTILGALCILLVGAAAIEAAEQAVPPSTLTHLPAGPTMQQLDGSAICCTDAGVFISREDLHTWVAIPGLRKITATTPLGGDRARYFAWYWGPNLPPRREDKNSSTGVGMVSIDGHTIVGIDADGKLTVAWDATMVQGEQPRLSYDHSRKAVAFGSKDIGAIAWPKNSLPELEPDADAGRAFDDNFLLTIDGGKSWKPVPPQVVGAKVRHIVRLCWVGPSRLLLLTADNWEGTKASVQLLEHKGESVLHQVWSAAAPDLAERYYLLPDGDYVWVGCKPMKRFRVADGQLDATVNIEKPVTLFKGMAACHQSLLVWGPDKMPTSIRPRFYGPADAVVGAIRGPLPLPPKNYLDIWARDPKRGYVHRTRITITVPEIATVLSLKTPRCLVIARDGVGSRQMCGMHLDLDQGKLSPATLQVTPLPPDPEVAAANKRWKEIQELGKQIPKDDRDAISAAVQKNKSGLSRKQFGNLLIKLFRQYLEEHKPKPEQKKSPDRETGPKKPSGKRDKE